MVKNQKEIIKRTISLIIKKKICVVTGSRSEFGLMANLLREIKKSKKLELFLLVTGMHLMDEFGNTYKEIEQGGFKIFKKIKLAESISIKNYVSNSVGTGVVKFSKIFKCLFFDDVKINIFIFLLYF